METDYILVAAIDFGTTFSGYALSFTSSKNNILMNKSWGHNVGFQSYKTPTCLLVNPQNELQAFGYEAEDEFSQMDKEEIDEGYHFFRHFKMTLYQEGMLNKNTSIFSTGGNSMKAVDIFSMALQYLKMHIIAAINQQCTGTIDESLMRWVITVPAIWSEKAKQFMREAAYQAGLVSNKDSRNLVIALEPEAASIYCRSLDFKQFSDIEKQPSFPTGCKYLVIDAGGGTIDVTAHEVLANGKVREIHSASGGAWGGSKVDENFVYLLKDIFGNNFITSFVKNNPQSYLQLMINFEKVKRAVKPDEKSKIVVPFPYSFGIGYREENGEDIDKTIKRKNIAGVTFNNGCLVLKNAAVCSLFNPVVNDIILHIEKILMSSAMRGCTYLLLVGGFGESAILQKAIRDKFGSKFTILVPDEAQLSVIKGAVLFGHDPRSIQIRIAQNTFGLDMSTKFNPLIHNPNKKIQVDNTDYCDDLFKVMVSKGFEIHNGLKKRTTYVPNHSDLKSMTICIFQSDEIDPMYIDDPGCKKLGEFTIQSPDTSKGKDREVVIEMMFGGTEIHVSAHDVSSGNRAETSVNFLQD